ncbi:MAG: M50 family metallopeptidase [Parachlamydiaceae bacterium]
MISISGRIPVQIYPFFWILILLIGWINSLTVTGTLIWSIVILVSVLIHEYGHALTALFFGQEAEINLVGLGGVTKRDGPKLSQWKEFLIVLNGPLAGFLLFAIAYFLIDHVPERNKILVYALEVMIEVNFFWTLLNLLPVLPLDGGNLLRILLEGMFGVQGLKVAFVISIVLAAVIGFYFFVIQQMFMGALFLMLGFESYRAWSDVKTIVPEDSDQYLQDVLNQGIEELKRGERKEALVKFSIIRDKISKGVLYVSASQYGARILAEQGKFKEAYQWLYPLKNRLSLDYLNLLQQIAYRLQEWEETVAIGEQSFQQQPTPETALMIAISYAIMGKAVPAVGWLRSASQQGVPDIQKVILKREFDAIRASDPFQKWVKSLENLTP